MRTKTGAEGGPNSRKGDDDDTADDDTANDDFTFKAKSLFRFPDSSSLPPLHAQRPPPPHARLLPPSSNFAPPLLMHDATGRKRQRKKASRTPSPGVSLYLSDGVTDVTLTSPGAIFAGSWEMGSCVSAQRSSSLESAVKRSLSSASRMEKPAVAPPLPAAREVPVAAAGTVVGVPLGSRRTLTFSDFGTFGLLKFAGAQSRL